MRRSSFCVMMRFIRRGSYYVREGSSLTAMIYIYCKSTRMSSSYGLKGRLLTDAGGKIRQRVRNVNLL